MKKWSTKMLVEAGIMLALAFILSRIKIFQAPQGGSVTAGSMIPIIFFALRWGVGPGIVTGVVFGLLKLMLGGYIFSPIQAILEYPIAFGFLGLAGIFFKSIDLNSKEKLGINVYSKITFSILLAISGRFLCHFIAGITFFKNYVPEGIHPWIYSLTYQASYLIPEFVITAVILSLLWKPLRRIAK